MISATSLTFGVLPLICHVPHMACARFRPLSTWLTALVSNMMIAVLLGMRAFRSVLLAP